MSKIRTFFWATTLLSTSIAFAGNPPEAVLKNFSDTQRQELKQYMQQYLMSNPQVIVAAVQKMQLEQQAKQTAVSKNAAMAQAVALTQAKSSPTLNGGPVTVVEFYDYQCSVCHMMFSVTEQFRKDNPNVRFVLKEFPIFGPASEYAAKATIAAFLQGQDKFHALHNALFKSTLMEGNLKNTDVDAMAQKAGLDMAKLKTDMDSAATKAELKQNYALAKALNLSGTPAFIVLPTDPSNKKQLQKLSFIPGGTDAHTLNQAVLQLTSSK